MQECYELDYIAFTRGAEGALLKNDHVCCDCPGIKTKIVDTVGAGDSYTAVLAFGILHKLDWNKLIDCQFCSGVCLFTIWCKSSFTRIINL